MEGFCPLRAGFSDRKKISSLRWRTVILRGCRFNGEGAVLKGSGVCFNGVGRRFNGAGVCFNGVGRRFNGAGVCFNGVGRRFNGAPRRCLRMAAARKIVCRRSRSGALLPEKEPNVAESRSVILVQGRYRLCCGGSGSGIGGSEESAEKARKNYKKNSKMSVKTLEKTVKLC